MKTYFHSGCLGDIIYSLPSIRARGPGDLYYDDRPWTKALVYRINTIIPLLMQQDCINDIRYGSINADVDFSTFRQQGMIYGETIIKRQARWARAKIDISRPWLQCDYPINETAIVVARGLRWPGFYFPWKQLVDVFGSEMAFIGLKDEYDDFTQHYGQIRYLPTNNLLEVARIIAGCKLFIGNQSCPLAIAEGLHKRTILEVCCWVLDCIHDRPGNIHVTSGDLSFEFLGKGFEYRLPKYIACKVEQDLMIKAEKRLSELIN